MCVLWYWYHTSSLFNALQKLCATFRIKLEPEPKIYGLLPLNTPPDSHATSVLAHHCLATLPFLVVLIYQVLHHHRAAQEPLRV